MAQRRNDTDQYEMFGAEILRGAINGKITYARIPIIRKDVLTSAAAEYADKVFATREIPDDTPPEILAEVRAEVMEDFMNGMRYALEHCLISTK
jgi:hypothetical protein